MAGDRVLIRTGKYGMTIQKNPPEGTLSHVTDTRYVGGMAITRGYDSAGDAVVLIYASNNPCGGHVSTSIR